MNNLIETAQPIFYRKLISIKIHGLNTHTHILLPILMSNDSEQLRYLENIFREHKIAKTDFLG